MLKIVKKKFF